MHPTLQTYSRTCCLLSHHAQIKKTSERRHLCFLAFSPWLTRSLIAGEVGRVTLDVIDLTAAYSYQTAFQNVPQVVWGLCGFGFDLDSNEDPNHFAYGHPVQEPNAIGVRINAYTTKTALVFERFDLGFGKTTGDSADICFQACTIGPGTFDVIH